MRGRWGRRSARNRLRKSDTLFRVSRNGGAIPRTPEEFGAELKRLRENAGVSLDDIVSETKIGIGVLRNLEAGRFSYLPERVFSRNFVKQFAEAVGFDPETLAGWFDMAWEHHTLRSGSHPAIKLAEPPPSRGFRAWTWGPILLGMAVLLVALAVLFLQLLGGKEGAPLGDGVAAFTPGAGEGPAAGGVQTVVPGRPAPSPTVEAAPDQPVARGSVVVEVEPGQECWIRTRDAHGRLDQRLLSGGERVEIPLRDWVQLTLGNAGAVTVRVGETVYRSLGNPGEVVHLEIGPDGLKRLSGAAAPPSHHG